MSKIVEVWRRAILPENASIEQAIANLDRVAIKIVLVVNEENVLKGTISDGDIRRGLLRGLTLASPIESVVHRKPLVVPPEMSHESILQLMLANRVQQIPVVNEHHHVVGVHLWDEMAEPKARSNTMVIMAGGAGTRLRPFTESCPKPLLPVGGKPILEHIIERARLEGFGHFVLAVHYLGHLIERQFGDGEALQVKIEYLREVKPLGTAGALSLFNEFPNDHFVVTNGDVLTDIRYGELLDFHIRNQAAATMAVRAHEWQNPFGVVHTQGVDIVGFEEKPIALSHINAGIYALSPDSLNFLDKGARCDMPSLFEVLQEAGKRTVAYPMHEPWLDIGRPNDLEEAQMVSGNNSN